MRNAAFVVFIIIVGAAAFIAYNAYFIVHQTQMALVLEFGNPTRVITKPGLYWKTPVVQTVEFFDKRILRCRDLLEGSDGLGPEAAHGRCLRPL